VVSVPLIQRGGPPAIYLRVIIMYLLKLEVVFLLALLQLECDIL
jgi:hypothetical protein